MDTYPELALASEQTDFLNVMLQVLLEHGRLLDFSKPGAGKTIMGLALKRMVEYQFAETSKQKVVAFVVQPGAIKGMNPKDSVDPISPWIREFTKYGDIDCLRTITTEALRVNDDKPGDKAYIRPGGARHPCIDEVTSSRFVWADEISERKEKDVYGNGIRYDKPDRAYSSWDADGLIMAKFEQNSDGTYSTEMFPTSRWMQFCMDHIVILFFDECQAGKNKTSQSQSFAALAQGVMRARELKKDKSSFVVMMSGTPMQHNKHAANYMSMLGFNNLPGNVFITSHHDAHNCYLESLKYNEEKTTKIAKECHVIEDNGSKCVSLCAQKSAQAISAFWMQCVMPKIHFSVPTPSYGQVFNVFSRAARDEDREMLKKANRITLNNGSGKKSALANGVKQMTEKGLVHSVVRDAIMRLNNDPMCKAMIALRFHESIGIAIEHFKGSGYEPLLYSGYVSKAGRERAHSLFQHSDEHRLVIGSIQTLSLGMDWQDSIGGRQRFTYLVGDDDIVAMWQTVNRTDRRGTKSFPVIFIFYSIYSTQLLRVYQDIAKKSEVAKGVKETRQRVKEESMRVRQSVYNTVLPGDYNRCLQLLGLSRMVYLIDRPYFLIDKDEENNDIAERMFPSEDSIGFIEQDTPASREDYRHTPTLVAYLEGVIKLRYDELGSAVETMSTDELDKELFASISNIPGIFARDASILIKPDEVPVSGLEM